MSDEWARLDLAWVETGTVEQIIAEHGGELEAGDTERVAMRLSHGSDGVVLYGTRADFVLFADKIKLRYGS